MMCEMFDLKFSIIFKCIAIHSDQIEVKFSAIAEKCDPKVV